jgi:hypothetical protein
MKHKHVLQGNRRFRLARRKKDVDMEDRSKVKENMLDVSMKNKSKGDMKMEDMTKVAAHELTFKFKIINSLLYNLFD